MIDLINIWTKIVKLEDLRIYNICKIIEISLYFVL